VLEVEFEMTPEGTFELGACVEDVAQEAIDAVAATHAHDPEIDVEQHLHLQLSSRGVRAGAARISEIAQAIRSGRRVQVGRPDGSVDGG
jgi:hypothetical protein